MAGESNGNGLNGSWRTWILGIIAGLILLGIAGSIVINKEVADRLGRHDVEISTLKERLIERTGGRFTREDADREFNRRDQERFRMEARIERLEKNKQ